MRTIAPNLVILVLSAASLIACGVDESGEIIGDVDGGEPSDADETSTGDGDGEQDAPASQCEAWEITYDLTGSEFEISDTPLGLGNQINTVAESPNADDQVGPGNFVIRFRDVDGAPSGHAFMVSHAMRLHFRVSSPGATVTTSLEGEAGPDECGLTSGALSGTTVAWTPAAIVGYRSQGQILCKGAFCKRAKLPKGKPLAVDEISDQPLDEFVFDDDLTRFTMAKTVIQEGKNSISSWSYQGTEVSRERIDAPACLCE